MIMVLDASRYGIAPSFVSSPRGDVLHQGDNQVPCQWPYTVDIYESGKESVRLKNHNFFSGVPNLKKAFRNACRCHRKLLGQQTFGHPWTSASVILCANE